MTSSGPPLRPNAPASGWEVNGQQEQIGTGSDGRPTTGVLVRFTTASGIAGSVFLPDAMYTPANVRAAIADRAARLDAVQTMKG